MSLFSKEMTSVIFPPLHPEGRIFLGIFAGVTMFLWSIENFLAMPALLLTIWCYYFFRNPPRAVPQGEGLIISPADGLVQSVSLQPWPVELAYAATVPTEKVWRVSVFMNVFNVHVNRTPIAGTVKEVVYVPGKFLNASLDKASEANERQVFLMESATSQHPVAFTQIAGLIARRITRATQAGDAFRAGDIFGMIRFGSRVDVFLPPHIVPLVAVGQHALAGETILADLQGPNLSPRQCVTI